MTLTDRERFLRKIERPIDPPEEKEEIDEKDRDWDTIAKENKLEEGE